MQLFIYDISDLDPDLGTALLGDLIATTASYTVQGSSITDAATGIVYTYGNLGLQYDLAETLPGALGVGGVFKAGDTTYLIATGVLPGSGTMLELTPDPTRAQFFAPDASVCFAPGTLIMTERGEIPVEALRIGDAVHCTHPGFEPRPVVWLGAQRHLPRTPGQQPVRICAGALGPGLPQRDLIVSPAHALVLEGHLVRAELLVNGASIMRDRVREITWHHVELDRHAVLLAEGAPAESYLDTGNRHLFGVTGLVAADTPDPDAYRARACLPILAAGPVLEQIQTRLLARARAQFGLRLSPDPRPRLRLGCGTLLEPGADGGFSLPADSWHTPLVLLSRSAVPAAILPGSDDARALGLCLTALELRQDGRSRLLHAGSAEFASIGGMYPLEQAEEGPCRWTDGTAVIPPVFFAGAAPGRPLRLLPHIRQQLPHYTAENAFAFDVTAAA